jgi:hypothetical protein
MTPQDRRAHRRAPRISALPVKQEKMLRVDDATKMPRADLFFIQLLCPHSSSVNRT